MNELLIIEAFSPLIIVPVVVCIIRCCGRSNRPKVQSQEARIERWISDGMKCGHEKHFPEFGDLKAMIDSGCSEYRCPRCHTTTKIDLANTVYTGPDGEALLAGTQ